MILNILFMILSLSLYNQEFKKFFKYKILEEKSHS